MTRLLLVSLLAGVCLPGEITADDKKDDPKPASSLPIQVVTLNRKEPVLYEKDIEPILVKKCQYCHSGAIKESQFDIGSFEGLMKGGKRGKAVLPGKSAESLLVQMAGKTK